MDDQETTVTLTATLQQNAIEYLGKGYRGCGYYADPRSCTERIFDVTAKNAFDNQKTDSFIRRLVTGKNRIEYFNKLSSHVKLAAEYSGFAATVTTTFSTETLKKDTVEFATFFDTLRYYRVSLLSTSLTSEARKAINTMDDLPALFDRYGTHYTKSIYLGARISYSSYLEQNETTSKTDIGATLKAEYLKLVGDGGGDSGHKAEQEEVARNATLSVLGGDPAEAPSVGVGNPAEFSATYKEWSKSIWPLHISIADFDEDGLVPLFQLAELPERRDMLQKAWQMYMTGHTPEYLRLLQPKPDSQRVVRYGDKFYLKYEEDGTYLSALEQRERGAAGYPIWAEKSEYYPTLHKSGRVKLTYAGGASQTPVQTGAFVQLVTEEDAASYHGKRYSHLGAWPGERCLYYYTPGSPNQDWVVHKVAEDTEYAPVCFGDRVFLTNRSYPDQRLCRAPSEIWDHGQTFLTTKKIDKGVWILERA